MEPFSHYLGNLSTYLDNRAILPDVGAELKSPRTNRAAARKAKVAVPNGDRMLVERELEAAYREASVEVDPAWEATIGDGLDHEAW